MASSLAFPAPPQASDATLARSLTKAFECFTEAAQSLENSYHQLEAELARLRLELEQRNADLAKSLAENRHMRDSLYKILEELPCGVLVAELSGRLSLVNASALRLLGAIDTPPRELAELPDGIRALVEKAHATPGEWELQIGPDGPDARVIAIRHSVVSPGSQESVFLLEDVSERQRAQRERERLERQRALTDLAAILAHEIRNPLGSLEVFAGLLAECGLPEEPRSWVEQVQAGLRTLAATVNNVLQFHNQPPAQLVPTDAGQILGWVCEFLQPLAKQASVQFVLDNQLDGVQVRADRHRLEQVLLNLAMNALRFMPGGGVLEVCGRAAKGSTAIEIVVTDTGPGIPPSDRERIFDAGYTTRPGSPGLGLTVCKTIVEQHGGQICAGNRKGGGASFVLRLPLGGLA